MEIVPAGRPFDLTFDNKNAGVPHNVRIADSAAQTTILFDGDVVTGPDTDSALAIENRPLFDDFTSSVDRSQPDHGRDEDEEELGGTVRHPVTRRCENRRRPRSAGHLGWRRSSTSAVAQRR